MKTRGYKMLIETLIKLNMATITMFYRIAFHIASDVSEFNNFDDFRNTFTFQLPYIFEYFKTM